jgi:pimeloyl-ACP methyl ester carboxylesterase
MPANAARTMQALFESCAQDPSCAAAYPHIETQFDPLFERLDAEPVTVPATDPRSGQEMSVVFDGTRLAGALVMAAAQNPVIPQIPGLIQGLAEGDHEGLKNLVWAAMPPPGDFAHGLSMAALCADYNTFTEDDIVFDGRFPAYEAAVAEMSWGPIQFVENCAAFGYEKRDPEARSPARSDVPTLILAGQLEMMTPPSWAHDTARTLSHASLFEVPGYGHSPTFSGPCPASMALAFIADPTRAPDDSCLPEMKIDFALPPEG